CSRTKGTTCSSTRTGSLATTRSLTSSRSSFAPNILCRNGTGPFYAPGSDGAVVRYRWDGAWHGAFGGRSAFRAISRPIATKTDRDRPSSRYPGRPPLRRHRDGPRFSQIRRVSHWRRYGRLYARALAHHSRPTAGKDERPHHR